MVVCLNDAHGRDWTAYHGDTVHVCGQLPDNSIGFSVYSPPFGNLFVYSDSAADMGNSASDGEFDQHYRFLVREKFRITKPGRLTAVHCSDLPMTKWRDGEVGMKDFSGQIIRLHDEEGWIYHSRVTIWKDPVIEQTRTKALGLNYGQLIKDSARSRVGMPDYLLIFRKPGDNAEPIRHDMGEQTARRLEREGLRQPGMHQIHLEMWQEWASPVWMTVNQTNTLNVKAAKEAQDERHLCPLQLDVIERALHLWSAPGDVVLSPFMGIGSEGDVSLRLGRRFVGVELKESYFRQAIRNLARAEDQGDMFRGMAAVAPSAPAMPKPPIIPASAADAFMSDIIDVCRRHGLTLGHEDAHGGFLVEPISEDGIKWLSEAQPGASAEQEAA